MMRTLFITSTVLFWLMVLGFGLTHLGLSTEQSRPVAVVTEQRYSLQEVAQHRQQNDCWMAIGGEVYDFTTYLPQHPSDPAIILPWCGKEATQAFRTKTKGRPHSRNAEQALPNYRIGKLWREHS